MGLAGGLPSPAPSQMAVSFQRASFADALTSLSLLRSPIPSSHHRPFRLSPSSSLTMASSSPTTPTPVAPKKVLVPIGHGTEEIEAVVVVDILRRAGADVLVASIESDLQIQASRHVKLVADDKIDACDGEDFDLIALPGGMPGSLRLHDCASLRKLTVGHAKQGKLVAAICAAPAVVLQEWGLLEGRKATCHPSFIDKLKGSIAGDLTVKTDGNVTTSCGPGTAIEFALSLVEQLFGKEKRDEVSGPLVLRTEFTNGVPKENFNVQKWEVDGIPRVLVPVANGTEEMEAVIIVDVLRRAQMNVDLVSVENVLQIEASRKMKIVADKLITDVLEDKFDLIVLPGGMPGAENLRDSEELKMLLMKQSESKRPFGAICASPAVVLEKYGFLKGKKATCHPAFVGKLSDQSAVDSRVIIDAFTITSRGPGTAMEFALYIVEKYLGEERARNIAEAMVFQFP